jgi:hypothetical protein
MMLQMNILYHFQHCNMEQVGRLHLAYSEFSLKDCDENLMSLFLCELRWKGKE